MLGLVTKSKLLGMLLVVRLEEARDMYAYISPWSGDFAVNGVFDRQLFGSIALEVSKLAGWSGGLSRKIDQ